MLGGPGFASTRILDFIGAKDDGGGSDSWSYKMCKAPFVTTNKPTPSFLQARCHSCHNGVKALRGNCNSIMSIN